jgi:hypothetical protein
MWIECSIARERRRWEEGLDEESGTEPSKGEPQGSAWEGKAEVA